MGTSPGTLIWALLLPLLAQCAPGNAPLRDVQLRDCHLPRGSGCDACCVWLGTSTTPSPAWADGPEEFVSQETVQTASSPELSPETRVSCLPAARTLTG